MTAPHGETVAEVREHGGSISDALSPPPVRRRAPGKFPTSGPFLVGLAGLVVAAFLLWGAHYDAAAIVLIAMALTFDYANGWHDAANSIATVVATRVLTPRLAVAWAAFFNFAAFMVFGTAVASTIGKTIDESVATDAVVFGALFGAIAWNVITWYFGLPTSSSHALIGGLVGAGVARAGWSVVDGESVWRTIRFIPLAPLIGMAIGLAVMLLIYWLFRNARLHATNRLFRRGQLVSAAMYSLGHGANDAQKTMGIIALVLVTRDRIPSVDEIPLWVVLSAHAAIALGTMSGGWRIVRTMGMKITRLVPVQGFAAETGAALTLFGTAHFGIPVSTTHTITGSILGVGATQRLSAVRWGVAARVVWAWFITIPAAAAMGALAYAIGSRFI
jgi:PiT family inorganic phosphate transporter